MPPRHQQRRRRAPELLTRSAPDVAPRPGSGHGVRGDLRSQRPSRRAHPVGGAGQPSEIDAGSGSCIDALRMVGRPCPSTASTSSSVERGTATSTRNIAKHPRGGATQAHRPAESTHHERLAAAAHLTSTHAGTKVPVRCQSELKKFGVSMIIKSRSMKLLVRNLILFYKFGMRVVLVLAYCTAQVGLIDLNGYLEVFEKGLS